MTDFYSQNRCVCSTRSHGPLLCAFCLSFHFNECLVANNRLVSELTCKYAECEELKQENSTLRDRVRDMSNAHNQEAWKAFQMKQLQKPELLIGSSITR